MSKHVSPESLLSIRSLVSLRTILVLAAGIFFAVPVRAQSTAGQAYTFTTLAGTANQGSTDGIGNNAKFNLPKGVAMDGAGNIYVADSGNNTIRKITSAGVVSTIAGIAGYAGSADGTGPAARFNSPGAVAADGAGNVYVADTGNNTIRKITSAGVVSTFAGLAGMTGTNDGASGSALFGVPTGLALDAATNLYVADSANDTIRKITPGGLVSTLAGQPGIYGTNDGAGANAQFGQPDAVAVDTMGNIYVADGGNNTIRMITPGGMVSTLAGSPVSSGTADGTNGDARFFTPEGIVVAASGNIYVADGEKSTIRLIVPMVSAGQTNWVVSTLAGNSAYNNYFNEFDAGYADGTGTNALFSHPFNLVLDNTGNNLYAADYGNSVIRKVTSGGVVSTVAGLGMSAGSADGTGGSARFNQPWGIAVDGAGNLYVGDRGNCTVREITAGGVVSTPAGLAGAVGFVDATGNNARFSDPIYVAVDSIGNVYVADPSNDCVRIISPGGVVRTAYGTNAFDLRYFSLTGVAAGTNGIFYAVNAESIFTITPDGGPFSQQTLAGFNPGFTDGTGGSAEFNQPEGIAIDNAGNVYVADTFNSAIRRITPAGVVTTLATGFFQPYGVAVDNSGNVYVANTYNDVICKLTPVGTNWLVTNIGGGAGSAGSADGTGSAALFNYPRGIAVDSAGNVYVADTGNNTIRKGVFTQFASTNFVTYTAPSPTGQLQVTLLPPEANGQWRFPWELTWRASGSIASNLAPGSYAVQFRNLPGYLAVPPNLDSISVSASGITSITNQYYPTINVSGTTNTGGLTVLIGPNLVNSSGWHFVGDPTNEWYPSGFTTNDLSPGTYFIEFKPINGYSPPPSQAVSVFASQVTSISVNYTLAQPAPNNVLLPVAVPNSSLGDLADYPFGFSGQLQTDVGYGSGVAVSTNVVLTAAHMVFNDQTLAYVNQVYWFWQQQASGFTAVPQQARGWYILSGYAAQRTNDLLGGLAPDESSPQSRNEDVAALYFGTPVAAGGFGGYLPSDAQPNTWLTSTANKMLVGYPVDGSVFGTNVVNGQMYEVGPQPYPLSEATDPVADQQVYTATWFLSYPGNSGGPFYVQLNGYYYPAGVYLGTLYNGIVPYASLVRGIDSNVVNLINLAATLGTGTNNSGGVIVLQPSVDISASNPGRIFMQLGPPAAVAEGAAWALAGDSSYSTATNYVRAVTTTNAISLVFKPIPGWTVPPGQNLSVTPNVTTVATATYIASSPTMLAVDSSLRLGLTGTVNTTYAIQSRASLTSGSWVNVSTNTISTSGFNLALPKPTNNQTIFYRAIWLGY